MQRFCTELHNRTTGLRLDKLIFVKVSSRLACFFLGIPRLPKCETFLIYWLSPVWFSSGSL